MIDKLLCNINNSILQTLRIINENTKGIVFVIDDNYKLKGVVSDGDIRRCLIRGKDLSEKVGDLINSKFIYAHENDSLDEIIKKTSEKILFIPIVNDKFEVTDFIQYDKRLHIPIASPNLKGNEFNYLIDAFLSTWISSTGSYITQFENNFSRYCGCSYGVCTSNGTVALHLALVTLGIGKGDEVIVPDLTFAATVNAVLHSGAIPVIVDIEKTSWCIDPQEVEKAITPNTKAIIPVHLFGQPSDMDAIMDIARRNDLKVIEDCAQAHGAKFKGKKVGSFGDINCFSFYGNKIITTGEGGMCITNSSALNKKMKLYRDHGMSKSKKYWHEVVGFNFRMTNIQAAIGVAQLERIDKILEDRRSIENDYRKYLSDVESVEFQNDQLEHREKITWLVSVMAINNKRDEYIKLFNDKGIDCRPFFHSLTSMPIYKKYMFSNNVSREISRKGFNFPTSSPVEEHIIKLFRDILKKS